MMKITLENEMSDAELRLSAAEGGLSVHLHGFSQDADGNQDYQDDNALIDGYSVYLRVETPDDPQQPFDTMELPDAGTLEEAQERASAAAWNYLEDKEAWSHD